MKLSKTWIKVTPLSKKIAMILFIALPFAGFYIGTRFQKNHDSQSIKNSSAKVEETDLSAGNPQIVGNSTKSSYKFEDFGLYSPLFTNKQVTTTTYKYKGGTILLKQIGLDL